MKTYLPAFIISLILLSGCKKESGSSGGNNLSYNDFRDKYLYTQQTFTADATNAFSITGALGTVINFPDNIFEDENMNVVNGNIDIVLKEINSRKDLVLSGLRVSAAPNWEQMIVGGEVIDMSVSQNSKELQVNPVSGSINIAMPSTTGGGNSLDVFYVPDVFNWTKGGVVSGGGPYNFPIEKDVVTGVQKWLSSYHSCDKPDPQAANATITVKVNYEAGYMPDPPNNDQVTIVKLIYTDAPSVVYVGNPDIGNTSVGAQVTNGRQAIIVAWSGGPTTPLYFGTTTVVLQAGANYSIDLKPITQSNLDAILNGI